jgi:hypothetical protein
LALRDTGRRPARSTACRPSTGYLSATIIMIILISIRSIASRIPLPQPSSLVLTPKTYFQKIAGFRNLTGLKQKPYLSTIMSLRSPSCLFLIGQSAVSSKRIRDSGAGSSLRLQKGKRYSILETQLTARFSNRLEKDSVHSTWQSCQSAPMNRDTC